MAKKKFGYLDYTTMGKGKDIMERYGVEGVHYGHPDGRSGKPNRTMEDVSRDIANKAMNDYDTRRTLEAQALAGNKDAKKFSKNGFKGIEDVFKANEMFKELHKDNGNGGQFSSNSDFAGLTWDSVDQDRKKWGSNFLTRADIDDLRAEMANDRTTAPNHGPIEHSPEVASAMAGNDGAVPKEDPQKQAASLFATGYKQDVAKGAGIEENRRLNLIRAAENTRIV